MVIPFTSGLDRRFSISRLTSQNPRFFSIFFDLVSNRVIV